MSTTELKVLFPSERLDALRFFMEKKEQTIEQELKDYLDKTYEKVVPTQVREYVESRMEQAPAQEQALESEQVPASRERPTRQTRRQRELAVPETPPSQQTQTEAESAGEEETPGMTMSM